MADRVVPAGIFAALLLAGCGGGSDAERSADTAAVDCLGSVYDPGELASAPPTSTLPDGPANATDDAGAPAFDPSHDWNVVHRSEDRVDLVRELDEPFDNGGGDVRTHERRTLERITGPTNVPDGTWLLTSSGPCTPRLVTDDGLGDADLTLARDPAPDDTSIELLVHERACTSGRSAEARVELLDLEQTAWTSTRSTSSRTTSTGSEAR